MSWKILEKFTSFLETTWDGLVHLCKSEMKFIFYFSTFTEWPGHHIEKVRGLHQGAGTKGENGGKIMTRIMSKA